MYTLSTYSNAAPHPAQTTAGACSKEDATSWRIEASLHISVMVVRDMFCKVGVCCCCPGRYLLLSLLAAAAALFGVPAKQMPFSFLTNRDVHL